MVEREPLAARTDGMPAWLAQWVPGWLPDWVSVVALIALAIAAGLIVHAVAMRLLRPVARRYGLFVSALLLRSSRPARLALVLLFVALTMPLMPLDAEAAGTINAVLRIGFIVLLGWLALIALHVASVIYTRRFRLEDAGSVAARKHLTQVKILKRTAATFIVILTTAVALMTLEPVRQYGVTLLASAGAAGIIVGLALQPLLTNLIAGVQIALTQPIRLEDAVIVEGEWGWVEEITTTYVVVRLWDWRRLVLPLAYFIQQPFQNWTRESAALIGSAMLYVDYNAPIEAMRDKLGEIARESSLWDGQVVNLAVTELSERTMEVRCLISAANAGDTFTLRCEVREKMIAFLRQHHPQALPRDRLAWRGGAAADAGAEDHPLAQGRPATGASPSPQPG